MGDDWAPSTSGDPGSVIDILKRLRTTTEYSGLPKVHDALGPAVAALLPQDTRSAIECHCEGSRWVLEVDPGCGAALIPWEAWSGMQAPVTTGRLALVRYCRGEGRHVPLRAPTAVRVLILIGNTEQDRAAGGAGAALKTELERLSGHLGCTVSVTLASAAGKVPLFDEGHLETEPLREPGDLFRLLGKRLEDDRGPVRRPHVVHYVGHSGGELHAADSLDFGGQLGKVRLKSIADALMGGPTRLLVLHACAVPDPVARELTEVVEHVVALGARVAPQFTALTVGPLYEALFPESLSVSSGVAAARRAVLDSRKSWAENRGWVIGHWTRHLEDRTLRDPHAAALRDHAASQLADLRKFEGFFDKNAPGHDALEQLTVYLKLKGTERPRDAPPGATWTLGGSKSAGALTLKGLIDDFPRLFPNRRRFILLRADPGAGKTTCLRMTARLLEQSERPFIYARLRDWKRGTQGDLLHLETAYPALAQAAGDGEPVVLLDGWDECEEKKDIEKLLATEAFRGDLTVVVASRTIHIDTQLPQGDWLHCSLEPLSPGQREKVLAAWFRAAGATNAEERARECLEQLPTRVHDLCAIPLYLALTAFLVVRGGAQLDEGSETHDLFERFFDMALKQKHRGASLPAGLGEFLEPKSGEKPVLDLLSVLALEYVAKGERDLTALEIKRLPEGSSGNPDYRAATARVFEDLPRGDPRVDLVEKIAESSELLDGNPARFGFDRTHKTFREALAARALGHIAYPVGHLEGLQEIVTSFISDQLDDRLLSVWAEILAMTTDWIDAEEKEAWVEWLLEQHPRLGYRALRFGASIGDDLLIRVLGLGAERAERWEEYDRRLEIGPLPAAESVVRGEALAESLRRVRPDGLVPDLAVLDDRLAHLELEAVDEGTRKRIADARESILDIVGLRDWEELSRLTGSVAAEGPERRWSRVPAGPFQMGSSKGEDGQFDGKRVTNVYVREFWIARTTVTLEQYRLFDRDKRHQWGPKGRLPATEVTWYEAVLFCRWLNRFGAGLKPEGADDLVFQLPSEAMWEYAARDAGVSTARFVNGDDEANLALIGWYGRNSGNRPHPVATASECSPELDLWDMHGNVWEWCQDDFVVQPREGSDVWRWPGGPGRVAWRVLRGGSYWNVAQYCRSVYRNRKHPAHALIDGGFRVVLAHPLP